MAYENLKKTGITYLLTKLKGIFLQIKDAIKSVNGVEPDENGNIELLTIPYAQQLQSSSNQRTDDSYIERTAGGAASIVTGIGSLIKILGNSTHEGYVAESIEMTVTPADPDDPNAITATINEAVFKTQAVIGGTYTFSYGESWDTDPATYGITVTGTPADGDVIEVVYVAEERGTIYVANPMSLITTGWNIYNNDNGYARVLKYSDNPDEKFGISGTYTALKFSATLDGAQTDITVSGGLFSVPSDGYVFVTGGNSTDTAIWMTWSDWTDGYEGTFVAYNEEEIDFSNEMASYFPYGLLKAGNVTDELNFNTGSAISRVERLSYSAGNRAIAEASGREYEFDQDYIYLERETPVTNDIDVDNEIRVNDHGMETITQTDIPVAVEMLYGDNLKNKLERNVLTISQQTLTSGQQNQVRSNIGASSVADVTALNSKISSIGVRSVRIDYPATFDANANFNTNLKTIIDGDLPEGTKCIGIVGYDSGASTIVIVQLRYYNGNYSLQARNIGSSAQSNRTAIVHYLYINS